MIENISEFEIGGKLYRTRIVYEKDFSNLYAQAISSRDLRDNGQTYNPTTLKLRYGLKLQSLFISQDGILSDITYIKFVFHSRT